MGLARESTWAYSPKYVNSIMCSPFCQFYKKVVLRLSEHGDVKVKAFSKRAIPDQVSARLLCCKRDETWLTKLMWQSDGRQNGYLSRMLFSELHTIMVNKGHFRRFRGCDRTKHPLDPPLITPSQARRQDLATRGPKTRRRGQKPERGDTFLKYGIQY